MTQKRPLPVYVEPFLYLLPFIVGISIFVLYPAINVFLVSFKADYNYITGSFSHFDMSNYKRVINDHVFRNALENTGIYVAVVVPLSTCIAIVFAVFLNQKIRATGLFQTAFFLPMVTSVTAVGLAWKWMYNFDYGIFNYFIRLLGGDSVNWLNDPAFGLTALSIYGIWSNLPFAIILFLAGLQNINEQCYIAARVDGASGLRIFFRITVPLLGPMICLVLVVSTMNAFKVFQELFPLFNGKPGAAYSLYTVVYYLYEQFYLKWKLGLAAAAAVILFFIILFITLIQFAIQRKWLKR
ncbi:MAG: sugar ABC transporter permease [Treponema sp.]|nr:sugar ABC transporter permease [Treponema sp.]